MTLFTETLGGILQALRTDPPSFTHLNRASAAIDQLGRRLHGVGYVRDREIAASLTAAYEALSASQELPEDDRRAAMLEAITHLEAALAHTDAGLAP